MPFKRQQFIRTKAKGLEPVLSGFKNGEIKVLVATDIAARGIDIHQLPCGESDLPNVAEDYVHRIGRTGRAGEQGYTISLVAAEEVLLLKAIEKLTGQLCARAVSGFEPTILQLSPLIYPEASPRPLEVVIKKVWIWISTPKTSPQRMTFTHLIS